MAKTSLEDLRKLLEKQKEIKFDSINLFNAVGMSTQETKHSRFLVWLLNPNNPHNLKNAMLLKLCDKLCDYESTLDDKPQGFRTNIDIIKDELFPNMSLDDKQKLTDKIIKQAFVCLMGGDVSAEPEIYIKKGDNKRYIDILIETDTAVITVENKTGSDTHTDQLRAYEEYINEKYPDKKKFFVFLSPQGLLPKNNGGNGNYNNAWCVFDYRAVLRIIKDLLDDIKGIEFSQKSQKRKLINILEDYKEMADKEILKETQKWKLVSKYASQIEDLYDCIQNKNKNLKYCRDWLSNHINGYIEDNYSDSSFNFHTQAIEDCFKRHNERYEYLKCTWFCGSNAGVDGVFKTDKNSGVKALIIAACDVYNMNAKNTKQTELKKTYSIIVDNDTWLMPLSDIKKDLEDNLKKFKQAIEEYDKLISSI